jgi:predicted nucleotidyltransferase
VRTDQTEVADLLFGAYRRAVLGLLLLRPGESFHVRRAARLTGVPPGSLHRELKALAAAGLLTRTEVGNQVFYAANTRSPVFKELASILEKSAGAPPELHSPIVAYDASPAPHDRSGSLSIPKRAINDLCRRYGVAKMSLFGSAARGELRPDSDVDVLVEFKSASRASSYDLVDMQAELSALFGNRKVDIASPRVLDNPFRRQAILPELRTIYVA